MGLQNKGCRHSDVQQKRNTLTSIFWISEKKRRQKNITPTGSPLGHQVEGHPQCLFPSHADEDVLVEALSSRGAHHKIKPAAVLDYNKYKASVDRSDQMLSYYSFERKTIKCWKKLFFHLFDLVVVNAHILHNKTSKKESRWKFSTKKSPKDCSLVPVRKFKFSMKKSLKDCSLVPVWKFKRKVRLSVQLADL